MVRMAHQEIAQSRPMKLRRQRDLEGNYEGLKYERSGKKPLKGSNFHPRSISLKAYK